MPFSCGLEAARWGHAQDGEGTLELRTGTPIIGHGIMAKEAQAIGVNDQWQAVLEQEMAKRLEVIPSRIGGDKDRAQMLSLMIINGQEQGLLGRGRPRLVDGRIVLPEFTPAGAFLSAAGLGRGSGWQTRLEKCIRTKAATDGRWRFKPKRLVSSSATSSKGGGVCNGTKALRNRLASGGQSGQWPVATTGKLGTELSAVLQPVHWLKKINLRIVLQEFPRLRKVFLGAAFFGARILGGEHRAHYG